MSVSHEGRTAFVVKCARFQQCFVVLHVGCMNPSVKLLSLTADDYCARIVDPSLAAIRSRLLQDRPQNVADYLFEFHDEIKRDIEMCSFADAAQSASDVVACTSLKQLPFATASIRALSDASAVAEVGEISYVNHVTRSYNADPGQKQSCTAQMPSPSCPLGSCSPIASLDPLSIIAFLHTCSLLKGTKRTGWLLRGLTNVESVADHSWRMAIMVLLLGSSAGVDVQRAMSIAVVHDLAEALVGDIAPGQGVDKATKQLLEADAMSTIVGHLAGENAALGRHVRDLWLEYEVAQSAEAAFVKDMDKLEMILQAREYERERRVDLQDFFDSTRGKIVTDVALALQLALLKERETAGSSFADHHL